MRVHPLFQASGTKQGFTLVELLVVIAIIGILVAMLLPAVQSAREAARKSQCKNNLRQIGVAVLLHENTHRYLPSGGWHFRWLGEPERGIGPKQPGGWIYNTLDFLEESSLRSMGEGLTGTARAEALAQRCATPIPIFTCPTRRSPQVLAQPQYSTVYQFLTLDEGPFMIPHRVCSDYAINTGDTGDSEDGSGMPSTLTEADETFAWEDTSKYNGVSHQRSKVRISQITDGTSSTYLVAEKHIKADAPGNWPDSSDRENMYTGFNNDNHRTTAEPPLHDTIGIEYTRRFGSAHASIFQAVHCDGSVHTITFSIDPEVHRIRGNREDGEVIILQ